MHSTGMHLAVDRGCPVAKTKPARTLTWRDFGDGPALKVMPNPESLHPGPSTVMRALSGNAEARAILDSYAFRFSVTTVAVLDV